MRSEVPEVRALLAELSPKVKACREALKAQNVGNALYGLQGMSSEVPEVRALLAELSPKVKTCREELDAQAVGNAFFGLREVELGSKWQDTVAKWLARLHSVATDESIGFDDIRIGFQSLALVSFSSCRLKSALQSLGLYSDLLRTQEVLLRRMQELQPKTSNFMSHTEEKYSKLAAAAFAGRVGVSVSSNEFLNGFESDLVIRVTSDGGLSTVINVELDGPHHKYILRTMRFCALRDQLLRQQHGVRVVRWDLLSRSQQRKSDKDIIADFQRLL
jgi:hypothetical protein